MKNATEEFIDGCTTIACISPKHVGKMTPEL
jgi:hypothetical protein